jgi:hypothetical protein
MTNENKEDVSTIKLRVTGKFKTEVESEAASLQLGTSAFTRMALADYIERRKTADASGQAARACGSDTTSTGGAV